MLGECLCELTASFLRISLKPLDWKSAFFMFDHLEAPLSPSTWKYRLPVHVYFVNTAKQKQSHTIKDTNHPSFFLFVHVLFFAPSQHFHPISEIEAKRFTSCVRDVVPIITLDFASRAVPHHVWVCRLFSCLLQIHKSCWVEECVHGEVQKMSTEGSIVSGTKGAAQRRNKRKTAETTSQMTAKKHTDTVTTCSYSHKSSALPYSSYIFTHTIIVAFFNNNNKRPKCGTYCTLRLLPLWQPIPLPCCCTAMFLCLEGKRRSCYE